MGFSLDLDDVVGQQVDVKAGLAPLPPSEKSDEVGRQIEAAVAVMTDEPSAPSRPSGPSVHVPQTTQPLSCLQMLDAPTRAKVEQHAAKVLPGLLSDPNKLGDFGSQAVAPLNQLTTRMLDEAGRAANIPELVQITSQLDDRIRGFTCKYDKGEVANTRRNYERMRGKALGFFNQFRDMLGMLLKDAKGVQAYLDSLEAKIEDYRAQLRRNVTMCNQLYAANEEAIGGLVGYIAVMEHVRTLAAAEAEAIVVEGEGADTRANRERREGIVEFIQALDVRIGEFQQRLMVAYATGPQIRNIRTISYGLGQRLSLLQLLTIPVFKLVIVQWVALEQAAQAGKVTGAVSGANNAALQAFASAGAQLVPMTAKQIQEPSTSPATILAMAESLVTQAQGIAAAYEYGIGARAEVTTAIVSAGRLINAAEDDKSAKVLELVRRSGEAELTGPDIADEALPDFMVQQASSVLNTGQLTA